MGEESSSETGKGRDEERGEEVVRKCEVCGNPSVGVYASPLGAISCAFCKECGSKGRQPWFVVVGALMFVKRNELAEWTRPYVEATCAFYKKTEDELWAEVEKAQKEYEEHERHGRVSETST